MESVSWSPGSFLPAAEGRPPVRSRTALSLSAMPVWLQVASLHGDGKLLFRDKRTVMMVVSSLFAAWMLICLPFGKRGQEPMSRRSLYSSDY